MICHKLGYYVTYSYTGTLSKFYYYRALCGDEEASVGADTWKSVLIHKNICEKCLKLRKKKHQEKNYDET